MKGTQQATSTLPGQQKPEAASPADGAPDWLVVSPDGLSQAEVEQRRAQFGCNELPEKKVNPLLKFLSYFWGPIPWMIEVAVILSAVVGHWADFGIILTLLVANAVVGFWEEFQAGNAIAALKAQLALAARVKRGGNWTSVPARELVPGDLIRVRLGDIVPADAALLSGDPIEVDQSALTGESLPVPRKTGETVYSGSIVRQGEVDAVVTAIGAGTYFGKTARLVETAHTVSHFQRAVLKIGDFLIVIALALVILILTVALFRHDPMLHTRPGREPALLFALVLTVAAIPVAMPTVLSVTMAIGARMLALKQAIVSKLVAIEELAGMDLLCSDKTGTLTQNHLTLGEPCTVSGVSTDDLLVSAALASRAEDQDPIDLAVLGGLQNKEQLQGYRVTHFQPFDPVHKRTEATGERLGWSNVPGGQGGAAGDPGPVGRRGRGPAPGRESGERFRCPRLPFPGRGSCGLRRRLAVPGRAAAVRPAARGLRIDHCDGSEDGRRGEDGDRRPGGHRQGDRPRGWPGQQHPRCQPVRGNKASRGRPDGRGHRRGRRLRPGLPGTQVPHCRGLAAERPHRRHDRRRGQRRPP